MISYMRYHLKLTHKTNPLPYYYNLYIVPIDNPGENHISLTEDEFKAKVVYILEFNKLLIKNYLIEICPWKDNEQSSTFGVRENDTFLFPDRFLIILNPVVQLSETEIKSMKFTRTISSENMMLYDINIEDNSYNYNGTINISDKVKYVTYEVVKFFLGEDFLNGVIKSINDVVGEYTLPISYKFSINSNIESLCSDLLSDTRSIISRSSIISKDEYDTQYKENFLFLLMLDILYIRMDKYKDTDDIIGNMYYDNNEEEDDMDTFYSNTVRHSLSFKKSDFFNKDINYLNILTLQTVFDVDKRYNVDYTCPTEVGMWVENEKTYRILEAGGHYNNFRYWDNVSYNEFDNVRKRYSEPMVDISKAADTEIPLNKYYYFDEPDLPWVDNNRGRVSDSSTYFEPMVEPLSNENNYCQVRTVLDTDLIFVHK